MSKYTKKEILDSLYFMYSQYCSKDGHDFMGAGELASEILEDYDYIRVDGAGRITEELEKARTAL